MDVLLEGNPHNAIDDCKHVSILIVMDVLLEVVPLTMLSIWQVSILIVMDVLLEVIYFLHQHGASEFQSLL